MINQKLITEIQKSMSQADIDGWLMYDFRRLNPLACSILGIPPDKLLSRRFFYWIPTQGDPIKLVHQIENDSLDSVPGIEVTYLSWKDLHYQLGLILSDVKSLLMEISPKAAIPTLSFVDAGTAELVESFGVKLNCSGHLIQQYFAKLNHAQMESHQKAINVCEEALEKVWKGIKSREYRTDFSVQQAILEHFKNNQFYTDWLPICALNEDSANPHFSPSKTKPREILTGDWILVDLGCREYGTHGVYADLTRVASLDKAPKSKIVEIFSYVKAARDHAIELIKLRKMENLPVYGWEVDDAARNIIQDAGYGDFFIHRTGHSIDSHDHGSGANIDNLETREERELLDETICSIEPGIYLENEFGIRLESNVMIRTGGKVNVTDRLQEEIYIL